MHIYGVRHRYDKNQYMYTLYIYAWKLISNGRRAYGHRGGQRLEQDQGWVLRRRRPKICVLHRCEPELRTSQRACFVDGCSVGMCTDDHSPKLPNHQHSHNDISALSFLGTLKGHAFWPSDGSYSSTRMQHDRSVCMYEWMIKPH